MNMQAIAACPKEHMHEHTFPSARTTRRRPSHLRNARPHQQPSAAILSPAELRRIVAEMVG
jgi:hypothetical protein